MSGKRPPVSALEDGWNWQIEDDGPRSLTIEERAQALLDIFDEYHDEKRSLKPARDAPMSAPQIKARALQLAAASARELMQIPDILLQLLAALMGVPDHFLSEPEDYLDGREARGANPARPKIRRFLILSDAAANISGLPRPTDGKMRKWAIQALKLEGLERPAIETITAIRSEPDYVPAVQMHIAHMQGHPEDYAGDRLIWMILRQ